MKRTQVTHVCSLDGRGSAVLLCLVLVPLMEGQGCAQDGARRRQNSNPVVQLELQIKSERFAATRFSCPGWDSNPHALTDTWPSTMPVYQFQHLGSAGCLLRRYVTRLGLEPRTLSLKVRCSNQLSYRVSDPILGCKDSYKLHFANSDGDFFSHFNHNK